MTKLTKKKDTKEEVKKKFYQRYEEAPYITIRNFQSKYKVLPDIWNFIDQALTDNTKDIGNRLKKIVNKDYRGWGETERWFDFRTNLQQFLTSLKEGIK